MGWLKGNEEEGIFNNFIKSGVWDFIIIAAIVGALYMYFHLDMVLDIFITLAIFIYTLILGLVALFIGVVAIISLLKRKMMLHSAISLALSLMVFGFLVLIFAFG